MTGHGDPPVINRRTITFLRQPFSLFSATKMITPVLRFFFAFQRPANGKSSNAVTSKQMITC
ncbi:hypothetical protein NS303_13735 [Pantoea ananatis]|nr:hypothetical protein NS303_13735 [Pantoea ananatis]KTR64005.1 hypothetical protein RSA47_14635 [Pantoea ananatis]KTR70302.1 hypothetical protein NS296_11970 [Pantoea ananatis]